MLLSSKQILKHLLFHQTNIYLIVLINKLRNDKGTVEVRLIDRLRALEQLAQMAESGGGDLESFLQALQGDGDAT